MQETLEITTPVLACQSQEHIHCAECERAIEGDPQELNGKRYCQDCFDNGYTCEDCGADFAGEPAGEIRDNTYCKNCWGDGLYECEDCGKITSNDNCYRNEQYCNNCFNERFTACGDCEETCERRDSHDVSSGKTVCNSCFESYSWCNRCDRYEYSDNMCDQDDGDDDGDDDIIADYSYKPSPRFQGKGKLFFGFELEVENCGDNNERGVAETLQADLSFIYCKYDGSLNSGFEIVSHPCTFNFLREADLSPIFDLAKQGFKSYETTTCGMHVHMSKVAFTNLHLYKFMKFFYENPDFILRISKRKSEKLSDWASVGKPNEPLTEIAKKKYKSGKYSAINLVPDKTVEIRIFRGTLSKVGFYRNLEFCHAVFAFTKNTEISKCASLPAFKAFVREERKFYPNLLKELEKCA